MVGLKVPKRIPVDLMRKILGDARTEDFLTSAYGPKLLGPPKITIANKTFEGMLALLEGRERTSGAVYQMLPAIMRLYFRESPQAKGRFMVWCRKHLAGDVVEENGQVEGIAETVAEMVTDVKKPRRRHAAAKKVAKRQRAGARG